MAQQWAGKTYGDGWLLRWLIHSLRFMDVRFLYVFAYIFVVPVCIAVNRSRKTSWFFYRKVLGFGWWKSLWGVYANHCLFAEVIIDKFAMFAGRKFKVEVVGDEKYQEYAARPEGFIQLSSHIGNYEIAGYTLVCKDKCINPVLYGGEGVQVMENRGNMFGRTNIHMIRMLPDMAYLFEIDEALNRGEVVSFAADRFMGGARHITLDFFGRKAEFPQGPFSVATMRGLDVLAINVMKTGWVSYKIFVTPLEYDKQASRKEQIGQLSGAYVAELEKMLRAYPHQWFNFYDFWN